jgi:hypothetical protein
MKYVLPAGVKGRGIIAFSWQATALFAITAILAAITPSALRVPALTVALVLFAIGMIIFLVAYIVAIGRSRYAVISVVGVYFMSGGVAPKEVRVSLLGALGVQIVVGVATAAVRPYTSLAFGVLVPLFGLAMCGLWSATSGVFPARGETPVPASDDEEAG